MMIVKFRIYSTLSLIFLLEGCSTGQTRDIKTYESFPRNMTLNHTSIAIKEPLTPSSIHLVDDVVVLIDKNLDHAIHFYDINDWSPKGKYGIRGDGPAEVQRPKFHGQVVVEEGETYLWFSDIRTYLLKKISLSKMLANVNSEPKVQIRIPPGLALSYKDVFAVSDDAFIGTIEGDVIGLSGDKDAGRFFRFNATDKKIRWMPNFPEQDLEVPEKKIGYLYASRSSYNNNTHQIASAMTFYDRIDIVDFYRDDVLTVMRHDKTELKDVDLRSDFYLFPPEVKIYYTGIYSTRSYIYSLYSNSTMQESMDFANGNSSSDPTLELHVFDWNGNAVFKAELDKVALTSFFVDETSWKLYAIDGSPLEENEVIISYTLPNLQNVEKK